MQKLEIPAVETQIDGSDESAGRTRILLAAYPLFVDRGYASVSMQEIAGSVSINKATLYHHFQSKDELFLAVARLATRRLHLKIEQFIQEGGSAADQLTRVALQLMLDSQSELGRLTSDLNQYLTMEQRQSVTANDANPWSLYESIFLSAVASGEIPPIDVNLAASMFVGLVYGQTWSLKVGRIAGPLDLERAHMLVETLFGGLTAVARNAGSRTAAVSS